MMIMKKITIISTPNRNDLSNLKLNQNERRWYRMDDDPSIRIVLKKLNFEWNVYLLGIN